MRLRTHLHASRTSARDLQKPPSPASQKEPKKNPRRTQEEPKKNPPEPTPPGFPALAPPRPSNGTISPFGSHMSKVWNPKRRRFLEAAAGAGVAGPLVSCSASNSPWRCLTVEESETAGAICDRLIPADEFPGALWAGAVRYIDIQLCGHLRQHREAYRQGLAVVDQTSRKQHGQAFAQLSPQQQDQLLKAAEKAKDPFFSLILAHTMQSYYGDPRHGGNRDGAGWRSIGYDMTVVRGRS